MLLYQNLRLLRILRITWKVDLIMLVLCAIAYWLEVHVIKDFVRVPTTLPSLIGTAIAFFIGFNNNQAYDRWWEARTIWGGIVNDSRSWARNVLFYSSRNDLGYTDDLPEADELPRRMILRHISFLYALKKALRGAKDKSYFKYISEEEGQQVSKYTNVPSALLDRQAKDLNYLKRTGRIDGFQFMTLNEMIVRFSDGMGRSERIKGTVFPPTYLYFTRLFIWLFVMIVTLSIADDTGPWSILLSWIIGFVFHVAHINGLSLMNPFEATPFGISLNAITRTIEINLLELLGAEEVPSPVEVINDEFIM
ncbi:bestrophin family protein [Spirosoma soli]|uniref:Bestrophin family protein n=1 Tax=Spirosoma soli TaxID=1770529 RepID=A0ABW5M011_9BACT